MKYIEFKVPKRKGGYRVIHAPDDELKEYIRTFMKECPVFRLKESIFCHGFCKGRNTVTAVLPHVGKKYLIVMDIKDFFNNIEYHNLSCEIICDGIHYIMDQCSKYSACPCDYFEKCFIELNDKLVLPQGAPSSPKLANLYLLQFDYKISRVAYDMNADYTRYADELIFSSNDRKFMAIPKVVERMLKEFGLKVNHEKTRIISGSKRLLGLVIDKRPNLPRKIRKKIRAALHNAETGRREIDSKMTGLIAYYNGVINNKKGSISTIDYYNGKKLIDRL